MRPVAAITVAVCSTASCISGGGTVSNPVDQADHHVLPIFLFPLPVAVDLLFRAIPFSWHGKLRTGRSSGLEISHGA